MQVMLDLQWACLTIASMAGAVDNAFFLADEDDDDFYGTTTAAAFDEQASPFAA